MALRPSARSQVKPAFRVFARRSAVGGGEPTGPIDPYFGNVVFLSSFDGADGATTATEAKGKALTFEGNAQIDTAQSKFGGASLLVDGTGDQVTVLDSADWDFGAGAFTVEGFVRIPATDTDWCLASVWGAGATSTSWAVFAVGGQIMLRWIDGNGSQFDVAAMASLSLNQWIHIATDRDEAKKFRLYINGVMVASQSIFTQALRATTSPLWIGSVNGFSSLSLAGWIDEVRITKGVARYASDAGFAVPTEAFPRS